jgi:hypothetical protein
MLFRTLSLLLLSTGPFFLIGCQSVPTAQYSGDPTIDVSAFKTFYLSPIPKDGPNVDEGLRSLLTSLDDYVVTALTRKGYVQASEETADMILAPRGRLKATTSVAGAQFGNYGTGSWMAGTPWGASSVNESSASVLVFCYAREIEKIAWLGWESSKSMKSRPNDVFEGAATALYQIIELFPTRNPSTSQTGTP